MLSLKASYLPPVFLHPDQVMFLLLLVLVVLKASYFGEKRRIPPWRCRAGSSLPQPAAGRPAACPEQRPAPRAAPPQGRAPGRPERRSRRSAASEEAQHGPCPAGKASGRRAEPTAPSPTAARHPTGKKGCGETQALPASPYSRERECLGVTAIPLYKAPRSCLKALNARRRKRRRWERV